MLIRDTGHKRTSSSVISTSHSPLEALASAGIAREVLADTVTSLTEYVFTGHGSP
jgi:hypothetical protein